MIDTEYKDLEARVDALRATHISLLKCVFTPSPFPKNNKQNRITKVYESETYDYPVQIQEPLSELPSSIGYNITSFAATNLKGTNLPIPAAPSAPPPQQHRSKRDGSPGKGVGVVRRRLARG